MKKLIITLHLILFFVYSTQAQDHAKNDSKDLSFIVNYLKETKYGVFKLIEGMSIEEWNYRPNDEGWTVSEIAEHIVEAEKTIYYKLKLNVLSDENKGEINNNFNEIDQEILKLTTDRSKKLNAPEAISPKGKWNTPEDFLIYFKGIRNRTINYIKNSNYSFRNYSTYFPPLNKNLDGYEWLLIIPSHTSRHLVQIGENIDEFKKNN